MPAIFWQLTALYCLNMAKVPKTPFKFGNFGFFFHKNPFHESHWSFFQWPKTLPKRKTNGYSRHSRFNTLYFFFLSLGERKCIKAFIPYNLKFSESQYVANMYGEAGAFSSP
jgi:hypothetical protein